MVAGDWKTQGQEGSCSVLSASHCLPIGVLVLSVTPFTSFSPRKFFLQVARYSFQFFQVHKTSLIISYSPLQKYECSIAQSCPTLCDSMDCSLPDSSVHGTFQVGILKQVAISYSKGSSQPRDQTHISCVSFIGKWILYHHTTWREIWGPDGQSPLPQRSEVLLQATYLNTFGFFLLLSQS